LASAENPQANASRRPPPTGVRGVLPGCEEAQLFADLDRNGHLPLGGDLHGITPQGSTSAVTVCWPSRPAAQKPRTLEEVYAEAGFDLAAPLPGEKRAAKRSRTALTRMRNEAK